MSSGGAGRRIVRRLKKADWSEVWHQYSQQFKDAMACGDAIAAFTALSVYLSLCLYYMTIG
jgi:hypothetical protein